MRGLLGVGDDGKDKQEKGRGWDTFFEIARKEEEFKEDPITDEQRQNDAEANLEMMFFIKGSCGPFTPIVHPDNPWFFRKMALPNFWFITQNDELMNF